MTLIEILYTNRCPSVWGPACVPGILGNRQQLR